jgi:hypothetical protein
MRPKARKLARQGSPPGWLEESDPGGVIWYVRDGRAVPPIRFPYGTAVALTGTALLRDDGISSCCYTLNVHIRPS